MSEGESPSSSKDPKHGSADQVDPSAQAALDFLTILEGIGGIGVGTSTDTRKPFEKKIDEAAAKRKARKLAVERHDRLNNIHQPEEESPEAKPSLLQKIERIVPKLNAE